MSRDRRIAIRSNHWQGTGTLLDYPQLTTFAPPHCLYFDVEIGHTTNGQLKQNVFHVVEFGLKAQVDYYYLRPHARVCIEGHLENDRATYPKIKTTRQHIVHKHAVIIVAEFIALGEGCDFDKGRQKMNEILEVAQERGDTNAEERLDLFRKFNLMTTPPTEWQ